MLFERLTGPFSGYFVAAYACEMGELGDQYLGFYKVCSAPVVSYWNADCLVQGCCTHLVATGEGALLAAERAAQIRIRKLAA